MKKKTKRGFAGTEDKHVSRAITKDHDLAEAITDIRSSLRNKQCVFASSRLMDAHEIAGALEESAMYIGRDSANSDVKRNAAARLRSLGVIRDNFVQVCRVTKRD